MPSMPRSAGADSLLPPEAQHRLVLPESDAEYHRARRLVEKGVLEQLDRGLYARTDRPPEAWETLIAVSLRAPKLIIWGTSALEFHGMTTCSPTIAYVGVEPHGWRPKWSWPPMEVNHVHRPEIGVGVQQIAGVAVRMTDPVRCVVDAFRRDDCMPVDIAIESMRMGFQKCLVDAPRLMTMSEQLGCADRLKPYVTALCT